MVGDVGGRARPGPRGGPALAALLLLIVLAPARAAHPRAGREALARQMAEAFRATVRQGVPSAIHEALPALAAADHPLTVDLLLDVLTLGQPAYLPAARRVLGSFREPETLHYLLDEGLSHRDGAVRAQVLLALGESRPEAVDWVGATRAALDDADPRVRAAAVRSLGRARIVDATDAILEAAADRDDEVRQEVPEALARLAGRRSLPALADLLDDVRWRVRLGAIRALAAVRTRDAAVLLVDRLSREQGRLREDLLLHLERLTGRNFGLEPAAWRAWLGSAPPDFLVAADSDALTPDLPNSVARYYGLSTLSTRFTFLTDLSGSMDRLEPGRYTTPPRTRLALTQDELTGLIGKLGEDVSFNLLTFAGRVERWRSQLTRCTPGVRKSALSEVGRYQADGSTNLYAALQAAFDAAQVGYDDPRKEDEAPDTIFLLSDGAPSAGELVTPALLLELAAERNRTLQLRIHCVALTRDGEARAFLARLARQTGGQYVNPLD